MQIGKNHILFIHLLDHSSELRRDPRGGRMNSFTRWMLGIIILVLIFYSCWRFRDVNSQLRNAESVVSRLRQEEEELRRSSQILCGAFSADESAY